MSDLISRQDAIDALESIGSLDTEEDKKYARSVFEALPSAQPKVRTQTSSADCISRQDAIEAIASRDETNGTVKVFTGRQVNEILESLPSADRPQGEWKSVKASIYPYGYDVECSVCGHRMGSSFGHKFCPMCGCRMKGADDE